MQHAPITTPIADKLASMPWIRWFRQLVDRVEEIKKTADAPSWDTIAGKPTEFPPSPHQHSWLTDLLDIPEEFPPSAHQHQIADVVSLQAELDGKSNVGHQHIPTAIALNDLTDVDTSGQTTGDVLVLESDNIWRPQAIDSGTVAASRIIDRFAMYARGDSRERDIIYDPVRDSVIWATGTGISRSLDGGVTISSYTPGYYIGAGSWLSWDEGRSRVLWIPYDTYTNGYYSIDSGATWTNIANLNRGPGGTPRSQPRFLSFPSSGRLVRISSYYGEIDYSDDAGNTWIDAGITIGGTGNHTAVGYDDRGFLWIIRGSTFAYSVDGASWTSSTIGTDCTCVCVIHTGAYSGRFIVCRGDGTKVRYSSDPRSVSWANPSNSFTLSLPKTIFHIPGTDLLAIISNNNKAIAYSNDGGASWTQYSDILGTNNGVERPTQTAFGSVCFMHAAADGATVTALRWGP